MTAAAGASTAGRSHAEALLAGSIALLALCAFLTLFAFRALDDNRLTSWQWVFAAGDLGRVAALLVAGLALAVALTRPSPPLRHPAPVLGGVSFLVAALFWREPEVIVDASRFFTQAKHLALYGAGHFAAEWGRGISAWTDLPLVPVLYGVVFALWGEGRTAVQVLTTLLFAGTVVLTCGIGKRLWDDTVGLYGGALLLGMPYLLTQVPLMLADVPTMFLLTLAIWASVVAVQDGGRGWLALASAAGALALLSKYTTWLLLSTVPVIALAHLSRGAGRVLARAAVITGASALVAGAVLLAKPTVVAEQVGLLWSYQVPGLGRWRESAASTFLFQIHPFITAAAVWATALATRTRDRRYAIVAWPVLLVLALQIGRSRYVLLVFPMLALMAACGLRACGAPRVRRCAVACIVVSALVVSVFGYLPHLERMSAVNLKDAGHYLDTLDADTVEVFALPQPASGVNPAVSVPLLDLFTAKRLAYRPEAQASSPPADVERSPLRFTWEYATPAYYAPRPAGTPRAVVLILGEPHQSLPDAVERALRDFRLARAFEVWDPWFHYRTGVRVYQPAAEAAAEGRS